MVTSVKLSSKEPTKAGNVFMGWCDQQTTDKNCTGTRYQPGDKITLSRSNSDLTLYAIWHDNKMQNFDGCQYLPMNKQIELVDTRDKRMYYVAHLADGNCWMTENLDLFIDANKTYTVADTDLDHATPEEIAECKKNSSDCTDKDGHYQWKPDKSTYTDNTWEGGTPGHTKALSYDPGDICWKGETILRPGNLSESKECKKHDISHYHVGNYYNYNAAVAQNNTSAIVVGGEKYETSICPIGWQLPNNEGEKSFFSLNKSINEDADSPNWKAGDIDKSTVHKSPYFLPYSGIWRGASYQFSENGDFRTNTVSSGSSAYILFNVGPSGTFSTQLSTGLRSDGFSIRCVTRN